MEENHCIHKGIEQLFNNGTNRHLIQVVDKSCGMRIIRGIPPSGSHPTWTADGSHPIWAVLADLRTGYFSGPCYVSLGRARRSHRRGRRLSVRSAIPTIPKNQYAGIAQLVEQLIRNQQASGSSPLTSSKNAPCLTRSIFVLQNQRIMIPYL